MSPFDLDTVQISGTPGLLYLEPEPGPYRRGYRLQGRGKTGDLLIYGALGPGIEQVWVCFDTSNGNPGLLLGLVYVWVYAAREEAWEKYKLHASSPDYASLLRPQIYALLLGRAK